jgi:hypothetical protein
MAALERKNGSGWWYNQHMGRIHEPGLRTLAEQWSPVVVDALSELGLQTWPPIKERQHLLAKPRTIQRFLIEGPARRGEGIVWALSHTSKPSYFDSQGRLTEGERKYWLVTLRTDQEPPAFEIQGAQTTNGIPLEEQALAAAVKNAGKAGPKIDNFYGNKGPISHR